MSKEKKIKYTTITPKDRRFLKLLSNKDIDPLEPQEIWSFIVSDPLHIDDIDFAIRLTYLYMEYYIDPDDEDESYDDLVRVMYDIDDILGERSNEEMVLSLFLGLPPFLIEPYAYGHYGIEQFTDETTGDVYAVGIEDDYDSAMDDWAENRIDNELEYMDDYWVSDYLSPNESAIEQLCEEYAEDRVENMSDNEILDYLDLDSIDDLESQKDIYEEEILDKEIELVDLEDEKFDLEEKLIDLEEEYLDDAHEREDYQDIENQIFDKEVEIEDKQTDIDETHDYIDEIDDKLDGDYVEEAKEKVMEDYVSDMRSGIDRGGLDFFERELGYDRTDAMDTYYYFDRSAAIYDLSQEDWGQSLNGYDGSYYEEWYKDENYVIMRTE